MSYNCFSSPLHHQQFLMVILGNRASQTRLHRRQAGPTSLAERTNQGRRSRSVRFSLVRTMDGFIRCQYCVYLGLVAFAQRLEPFERVGIEPQRHRTFGLAADQPRRRRYAGNQTGISIPCPIHGLRDLSWSVQYFIPIWGENIRPFPMQLFRGFHIPQPLSANRQLRTNVSNHHAR